MEGYPEGMDPQLAEKLLRNQLQEKAAGINKPKRLQKKRGSHCFSESDCRSGHHFSIFRLRLKS